MSTILWIIIITAISGIIGTGLGGLIASLIKGNSDKTVSLLLSFAGGVMLSVVCFDLILDAIEPIGDTSQLFLAIAGMIVGYGVIFLLNHWIDKSTNHEVAHIDDDHPRTADDLSELIHSNHLEVHRAERNSQGLFVAGLVMAMAIALHNMPEGMVIGASFANGTQELLMNRAGLTLAAVIGLHNIPEGMAVAVPLISGGMKRGKAVAITAASGAPTVLGAVLGYYMGTLGRVGLALSLSFASGAMLYVVFGELLPEAILMWKSKAPAFATVIGIAVGMVIIFL